ncbi:tRNA (adenosine(37)-N6)-threonylcarbamoyltransferase complex ATPase subunit type 1 TsaE [Kushneria aurantia]|uniref:tRNA threonylcarbamoyladenosine biosynthesis protein TsaE n=1 Tax=Kushneria aurantia TaxID=504092 RepID=A0ABV6G711_9GAMM|nr:tRNA (adenosine(37)-N6)-threonylcarbamoyltransferase complex ATPase subunit type 1 TsaE [Kushneria aurantia]
MTTATAIFELHDEQAQVAFGARLAEALGFLGIVYLSGELGAGKTTLARGALRALGHEGAVRSPTYTLVEPYKPGGERVVYHFDLYRLGDPEELEFIGARDMLAEPSLALIEWPQRGAGWLPAADVTVTLTVDGAGRRARLSATGERGRAALAGLATVGTENVKLISREVTP